MIKAVIYDLDDLMVNSILIHVKADDVLLKRFGHKTSDLPPDLNSHFVGMRVIDILKKIIEVFKLDVDLSVLYKNREKIFLELAQKELELMPGLVASLDFFQKNGFKIAMSTSANKDYLNLVLNKFKLKKYFEAIVTGDDVKSGKPDPEIYLATARKLGLKPADCLVLEDATAGIASAKAAGCKCIAIINNYTPPQDLSKADLVLNSLFDINLKIVNSLN